ncbi:MAG TPA: GNAT family N-acetyltransferase [Candidatus Dormibacteraeota bacterium]
MGSPELDRYHLAALPEAQARELYELERDIHAERRPDDPWPGFDAWRRWRSVRPAHLETQHFRLRAPDGTLAGQLDVRWPKTPENRHIAECFFAVAPGLRRQGLGSRLLAQAAEAAEQDQRTFLAMPTHDSVPAGSAFLTAVGAKPVLEQHENRLQLAEVDRVMLRSWIEAAETSARDYELVFMHGPTPPELVEEVARAVEHMNGAPRGDSVSEDVKMTPEQVSGWDEATAAAGLREFAFFARHRATGHFVGFTNLTWNPDTAALLQQGGTAVDPAHRGHGLGKWLKASMLEKVFAEIPEARAIETENAFVNEPMLSINNRLGFRPHGTETWWEIETSRCRRGQG